MSKISALERAKKKLAEPEAGNNSNVTLPPFDLDGLPKDRNADLWNRIEERYSLKLDELSALQNFACSGNIYVQHIN